MFKFHDLFEAHPENRITFTEFNLKIFTQNWICIQYGLVNICLQGFLRFI